jgi:hypothetical protein
VSWFASPTVKCVAKLVVEPAGEAALPQQLQPRHHQPLVHLQQTTATTMAQELAYMMAMTRN